MKAIVYKKYGPPEVLQICHTEKPVPAKHEVLIKILATTVTKGDVRMRSFDVPAAQWLFARIYLGLLTPRRKILGMTLAGEIESTGSAVTCFKKGDQVFASTFGADFGGYAEYKCMHEYSMLFIKPEKLSFEEAAAIPGGSITALRFLRRAKIKKGQKVLIYGASGAVGTYAVQLARYFGAEVTGICSAANFELVKSLGAQKVVDYTNGEFLHNLPIFDIVFDAVGKTRASLFKRVLKKHGRYLNVHQSAGHGAEKRDEYLFLMDLFESGKIKPVIDRVYPFEQIVEAHRYTDQGHKKGNVVLTLR